MPTLLRWTMTLPLAIAFVSPVLANPAPPRQAESVVSLFCYMVTTDGQVRDLSSLCGSSADTTPQPVVQNTEPCYFLDSDGKPCTATGRPIFSN
ncbi:MULTISPECIES: hypothetical protein [Cyanophyceae]|uniref:Uncharacterized protein n=1 Tax=Leptolyngbya subtilissima DQ-A4 TaxID=2933933 RepID=A0ABV0KE73_9CYAN|nr:hypothetical protein [Nodosilinea sp. FACHB-141]MBD2113706.1 hypothetical protein [Nodosilinea sp. FACHB-141]